MYLGHIVSKKGIGADPAKLSAISDYSVPLDVKQHQHCVLNNKKGEYYCYRWNKECQEPFELLKQRLVSPPILAFPQFNHQFTDASSTALGAVLSQIICGNKKSLPTGADNSTRQSGILDNRA